MKKKILLLVIITLLLIPIAPLAKGEYQSKNLVETLEEEGIDLENEDYKETDKQVTIYMFRGTGCSYCKSFLNFLNAISDDYGKYFKLESYEVWANANNSGLLESVSSFLGEPAGGVPYIIIGDQVFAGYSEKYNDAIKSAIKEQYNKKEKYDVMVEYEKAKEKEEKEAFFSSSKFITTVNVVLITVATIVIIVFVNVKVNSLKTQIDELKQLSTKEYKHQKEEKKNKK